MGLSNEDHFCEGARSLERQLRLQMWLRMAATAGSPEARKSKSRSDMWWMLQQVLSNALFHRQGDLPQTRVGQVPTGPSLPAKSNEHSFVS